MKKNILMAFVALASFVGFTNVQLHASDDSEQCICAVTVTAIDTVTLTTNILGAQLSADIDDAGTDEQVIGIVSWCANHGTGNSIKLTVTQVQSKPALVPADLWWVGREVASGYSATDFICMNVRTNVDPLSEDSYTYTVPTNVTRTVDTNAADLTTATINGYEGLVGEASFVAIDDATNASGAGLYTGKFLFKLE